MDVIPTTSREKLRDDCDTQRDDPTARRLDNSNRTEIIILHVDDLSRSSDVIGHVITRFPLIMPFPIGSALELTISSRFRDIRSQHVLTN